MDHRHGMFVRATESDSIRRWATLEGKSATMKEDLLRRAQSRPRRNRLVIVGSIAELAATLVHAYLHIRNR
ncbi:MAG TPA: hypothetical protein VHE81_12110 [Lacipirellulaceae bacterium]|nr:hypothetical protein [Lacipirellulaceae bacterium]